MNPKNEGWGKVYFCPTPLGNLKDITLRVLEVLKSVDCVVCEDTRVTLKLLNAYGIRKPLLSYHAHNLSRATREILKAVKEGKNLAFVSDAGTPGIQDPGMELVSVLLQEGVPFEVLPGPSALVLGVVYSGFSPHGFTFLGFLPRKTKERKVLLQKALSLPQSTVLYESPHRLWKTLKDLQDIGGEGRKALVARELTKLHEEILRGSLGEIQEKLAERNIRGEVLIVVEGKTEEEPQPLVPKKFLELLLARGMTPKDVVEIFSEGLGIKKSVLKEQIAAFLETPRQPES
ncbi:MAG: 16S rRNA (cytidine(1402)-2'-O)-methyltransferase [Candidatus Caldatribacteriaceae bacterium]